MARFDARSRSHKTAKRYPLRKMMENRGTLLLAFLFLATVGCGSSSDGEKAAVQGRWIGTVTYDAESCGPNPSVPIPNLTGQEFLIQVFDDSSAQGLCGVSAIDQEGRRYFLNESAPCELDAIDEFVFAPELDDGEGSTPQNPTGIVFRDVTLESAQVSIAFFINRLTSCRFFGNFSREGDNNPTKKD